MGVWLYMVVCLVVWGLCLVVCDCVWLYVVVFSSVWLFIIVCGCLCCCV